MLEGRGDPIAIEVSVTTNATHELANIEKCLGAGYSRVFSVLGRQAVRSKLEALASKKLEPEHFRRVTLASPEELLATELDGARPGKARRVRGYEVKVGYEQISEEEKRARMEAVARILRDG